jgi:hypothetical protein
VWAKQSADGLGLVCRGGQTHRSVGCAAAGEGRQPQEQRVRGERLAVARGDLATARTKAAEYATLIAPRKAPFEARQLQELRGSIALAEKRGADAVKELSGANQQDPKVLYLTALAFRESGDARQAAVFAKKAARFNGLAFNYAYVRTRAAALIGPATE